MLHANPIKSQTYKSIMCLSTHLRQLLTLCTAGQHFTNITNTWIILHYLYCSTLPEYRITKKFHRNAHCNIQSYGFAADLSATFEVSPAFQPFSSLFLVHGIFLLLMWLFQSYECLNVCRKAVSVISRSSSVLIKLRMIIWCL